MASIKWRLYLTCTGQTGPITISEMEMMIVAAGVDQCTGGAATSNRSDWQTPTQTVDDNINTWWGVNQSGSDWLQYVFTSCIDVVEYSVRARNDSYFTQTPREWQLQYYDGSTWVTQHSVTGEPAWTQGERRVYTVTNPPWTGTYVGQEMVSNSLLQTEFTDDALHVSQSLVQVEYGTTKILATQLTVEIEFYSAFTIIVDTITRIVLMAGEGVTKNQVLTSQPNWSQEWLNIDSNVQGWGLGSFTTIGADIYENIDLPEGFIPFCWTYSIDGVWAHYPSTIAELAISRRLLGDNVSVFIPTSQVVINAASLSDGVTTTSVTLTWDKVYMATQYEIRYKETSLSNYSMQVVLNGEGTSVTATVLNLKPGTSYDFQIRALTMAGATPWTLTISKVTSTSLSTALSATVSNLSTASSGISPTAGSMDYDHVFDSSSEIIIYSGTPIPIFHNTKIYIELQITPQIDNNVLSVQSGYRVYANGASLDMYLGGYFGALSALFSWQSRGFNYYNNLNLDTLTIEIKAIGATGEHLHHILEWRVQ